ncbi:MAG: hypothetical protein A3F72_21575 [Bacteroidetes bacterium RIFCSPLOWO2_12_FULL_35_15]|nr:MAG: hypothetical protein A3F72_21575 [Bacteroidetes bacterium RIFCSPLOWO2_12_FULL_35_15]
MRNQKNAMLCSKIHTLPLTLLLIVFLCPFLWRGAEIKSQTLVNNGAPINNVNSQIYVNGGISNKLNGLFENSGSIYLTGDWSNTAGNAAFTGTSTGAVIMQGVGQNIEGTSVTEFYNLMLEGAASIKQLVGIDAIVKNQLDLNDCELATNTNTIYVTNTSSTAITRNIGFVSSLGTGALVRNTAANSPYFFPVGSSVGTVRFRPIELTPDNSLNNSYAVRMANTDATSEGFDRNVKQSEIESVNPLYYHRINRITGNAKATIAIYYDAAQDGTFSGMAHWQNMPQWENMLAAAGNSNYGLSAMNKFDWDDFTTPAYALLKIKNECGETFVPNAFSPDNDGANDLECVLGKCIQDFYFAIYDRWGEKIFETTDQKNCWDGTYKGKLMNTAVFVYYLKVTLTTGELINKKGNITLIR